MLYCAKYASQQNLAKNRSSIICGTCRNMPPCACLVKFVSMVMVTCRGVGLSLQLVESGSGAKVVRVAMVVAVGAKVLVAVVVVVVVVGPPPPYQPPPPTYSSNTHPLYSVFTVLSSCRNIL